MAEIAQSEDQTDENEVQDMNLSSQSGPDGLRSLAAETRLQIFKYALSGAAEGTTPALVKALRGQQPMYEEALSVWYATSRMRLGPGRGRNSYSLIDLSTSTLQLLRKLHVQHEPNYCRGRVGRPPNKIFIYPDLAFQQLKVLSATQLQYLCLDFSTLQGFTLKYDQAVELWLQHMKVLKTLVIKFQGHSNRFDANKFDAIDRIDTCLGVYRRSVPLPPDRHQKAWGAWVAESGKFLTWIERSL